MKNSGGYFYAKLSSRDAIESQLTLFLGDSETRGSSIASVALLIMMHTKMMFPNRLLFMIL
jgi:hypothetical protein